MFVYFAVSLTVLLGFAGMAIDVGRIESGTIQLQAVADDAALTAAAEYQNGNSSWQTIAAAEAASAGTADGLPSVGATFQIGANTGPYTGYQSVVQATVTQQIPLYLIPLVSHTKTWTLTAQAVAQFPPCSFFTGADPNGYSVELSNMNPLDNKYCPVYEVNDSITNSSWWNDSWVEATGAASASSISSGAMVHNPIYNQTVISDPLSYETAPVFSACTSGDKSLNITTTRTLNPGTYCGGLTIGNNTNVTMNPGLYIITGGMSVGLGGTLTGNGVTLYFTQGGGSGFGNAIIGTSHTEVLANVALTAPTSSSGGGIPGIVLWVDSAWTGTGAALQFTNCNWTGDGIIYSKTGGVTAWWGTMEPPDYFGFDVAYFYNYETPTHILNNYSSLSAGDPFRVTTTLVQ